MCPKPNDTRNAISKKSHVEELEGIPGLFSALTEEADIEDKWSIFSFPVDFDSALYGNKVDKEIKFVMRKCVDNSASIQFYLIVLLILDSTDQELDPRLKERKNIVTLNCTTIYFSQCMSWNKCRESCSSMGANSYRSNFKI